MVNVVPKQLHRRTSSPDCTVHVPATNIWWYRQKCGVALTSCDCNHKAKLSSKTRIWVVKTGKRLGAANATALHLSVMQPPEERGQKKMEEELHCPADHVTVLSLTVCHVGMHTVFGFV